MRLQKQGEAHNTAVMQATSDPPQRRSASSSGIHLLGDLSRRLVRRCGLGIVGGPKVKLSRAQVSCESADEKRSLKSLAVVTNDDGPALKPNHRTSATTVSMGEQTLGALAIGASSASCQQLGSFKSTKCRRQKDSERVEKLRLLVSYLRSGSSQPLVSRVELEADEIELAERYKLHLAFRDDLLNPILVDQPGSQQSKLMPALKAHDIEACDIHHQQHQPEPTCAASSVAATSSNSLTTSFSSMNHRSSVGVVDFASNMIKRAGCDNHHHSTAPTVSATHSTPHIGQVASALRHSISDPGNKSCCNNICHSEDCSASNSGVRSSIGSAYSSNQYQDSYTQFSPRINAISANQVIGQYASSPAHQRASSCKAQNNSRSRDHSIDDSLSSCSVIHQSQQPTRLFYIDDLDAPLAHLPPTSPKLVASSTLTPSSHIEINATMNNDSMATVMTQETSSGNFTSSMCSYNSRSTAGGTVPNTISTLSSSKSCGAWTNPQNLASWIDNEVNSLVHDLEVNESKQNISSSNHKHQHSGQKHSRHQGEKSNGSNCKNKDGKRRWLSVTRGASRRNSSGAQST